MKTKKFGEAYFNYIGSITLPMEVVEMCSQVGDMTENVQYCLTLPEIKAELSEIDKEALADELWEYGVWDKEELSNHSDNLERILCIAACNISED